MPLFVLNINNNNSLVNKNTIKLEKIPINKEKKIDCFNLLIIIFLLSLYP